MEDAAQGFNTLIARPARFLAQHQQTIKWIVYSLLLLNFSYYVFFEWRSAQTLLSDDASFLEIASVYTTTFDELGWFVLLFIFEYETYWMDDKNYNKILYGLLQVVGLVCYVVISHTLYAYIVDLMALGDAVVLDNVTGLCGFVGEDISFINNLYYTLIDANNCAGQSGGGCVLSALWLCLGAGEATVATRALLAKCHCSTNKASARPRPSDGQVLKSCKQTQDLRSPSALVLS